MKLVDANVLLYAVNADAEHHDEARGWLDEALGGAVTIGFAWVVTLAFVRLATHTGVFPEPLSPDEAIDRVDAWIAQPAAAVIEPAEGHLRQVRTLLAEAGGGGNLVNDAHLAALAIERNGAIVSYDHDFARFDGVKWERPGRLHAR